MRPMLATRGTACRRGAELGARGQVGRHARARRRHGRRAAAHLPQRERRDGVVPRAAGLGRPGGRDMVLDGEIVAFLDGIPRFGALADRMHVKQRAPGRSRWPSATR